MRAGIKMSREEVPEVRDQERRESYLENVNAQRRRLMKRRMEMRDDHRKPSGGIMQSWRGEGKAEGFRVSIMYEIKSSKNIVMSPVKMHKVGERYILTINRFGVWAKHSAVLISSIYSLYSQCIINTYNLHNLTKWYILEMSAHFYRIISPSLPHFHLLVQCEDSWINYVNYAQLIPSHSPAESWERPPTDVQGRALCLTMSVGFSNKARCSSCQTNARQLEDTWDYYNGQHRKESRRPPSLELLTVNMQRIARLPVQLSGHALGGKARLLSLIPIKSCDFA